MSKDEEKNSKEVIKDSYRNCYNMYWIVRSYFYK